VTATVVPADRTGEAGVDLPPRLPLGFELGDEHLAHEPPEVARVQSRDAVRMMVSAGSDAPRHHLVSDLPEVLSPGDLLVVNTSATVPAAIDTSSRLGPIVVHVSTRLPGGLWIVEPRSPLPGGATEPTSLPPGPHRIVLDGGAELDLFRPAPGSSRLWLAATVEDTTELLAVLERHGRPIRYRYVERDWPLAAYQTVFASRPGSAEMPSAARPFTPELVTRLIARGVELATVTLHTGVSSLEAGELPYPEWYEVPVATAASVNASRSGGRHVVAVGTTVVRALESAADRGGTVHPASGWTDTVVTPARGVRVVDGLLSGWHEPAATHLAMLEAVAGPEALALAYEEAHRAGYLWHEFGDSHLLLPYAGRR
jgi:S-adenosylmethionine:tRNA ribosyltransferase-isomerase